MIGSSAIGITQQTPGQTLSLRPLGSVFGAALTAIFHTRGVEGAANDVIADTGKILNPAPTNHDYGVFLQVVANTGNVGRDLKTRGEANPRHFPKGRVGLLGRGGVYTGSNPPTLGTAF